MALAGRVLLIQFLCLLCSFCLGQDRFSISRSVTSSSDVFKMQASNCSSCSSYAEATDRDPAPTCKCTCRDRSSTFGFHTSSWYCLGNKKLRQEAGKYGIYPLSLFGVRIKNMDIAVNPPFMDQLDMCRHLQFVQQCDRKC